MGKINEKGIELIKHFEGFSSELYRDGGNLLTIGIGSTRGLDDALLDSTHRAITEDEAEELLRRDLGRAEYFVARLVRPPLTSNQFAALVSICFNIGSGNFQASTFRMKLNRYDYAGCADNFWQWRRVGGSAGRISNGLVRRRAAEKALFLLD
jgi:lysozyme|tara:strand:- start:7 stop:465 length:459 start_codon:yes stop_codon:yes gene_type:complete